MTKHVFSRTSLALNDQFVKKRILLTFFDVLDVILKKIVDFFDNKKSFGTSPDERHHHLIVHRNKEERKEKLLVVLF